MIDSDLMDGLAELASESCGMHVIVCQLELNHFLKNEVTPPKAVHLAKRAFDLG